MRMLCIKLSTLNSPDTNFLVSYRKLVVRAFRLSFFSMLIYSFTHFLIKLVQLAYPNQISRSTCEGEPT
jgi:hypothetical protein